MNKNDERNMRSIAKAVTRLETRYISVPAEQAITSIKTIERATKIDVETIARLICTNKIVTTTPEGQMKIALTAQSETERKSAEVLLSLRTPRKSQQADTFASRILGDTQRYARRPQFPEGNQSKTTRKRIEALTSRDQIRNAPIFLCSTDEKRAGGTFSLSKEKFKELGDPKERFSFVIRKLALFPTQNTEAIQQKMEKAYATGEPFTFSCFACLPIECSNNNGTPNYEVGQQETRLEVPKIVRRTKEIITLLKKTGVPFKWDLLIGDTDLADLYGKWLGPSDQEARITAYTTRLLRALGFGEAEASVILWSKQQEAFQASYQENFQKAFNNAGELVGNELLNRSVERRIDYFRSKGLPITQQVKSICKEMAQRNIAIYASQGPILEQTTDCLVIADPDPLRLGKYQSLLAPNLPIWYPYGG